MKKMKPAFMKAKGYMDGGSVSGGGGMTGGGMSGNSQRLRAMPASARGYAAGNGMTAKMADGGYVCGHAGKLTGKNMKKGK